jgi:hypothetical protein
MLPTVSAISTIPAPSAPASSSVPTTPTAATSVAAATASVTTASSGTPASAAAFCLRPRFIDHQVPAAEILAVQGVDGAIGVFVALHLDEGKTARLSCETITNQIDA